MKKFILSLFLTTLFVFTLIPSAFAHDPLFDLQISQIPSAGFDMPIYIGFKNEAYFVVRNNSDHTMRGMDYSLKKGLPSGMEIAGTSPYTTCIFGGTLAPGGSCNIEVKFTPTRAEKFTGALLHASSQKDDRRGVDSAPTTIEAENAGMNIVTHTETDLPYVHLAYKAIVIKHSDFPGGVSGAIGANISELSNDVNTCWSGSSTEDCEAYGDPVSYINNGLPTALCTHSLSSGQSCHFWVRALKSNTVGLGLSNGTVDVTYNGNTEGTFTIDYSQDLYVGGKFNSVYGGTANTLNKIARWDGSSWFPIDNGMNNAVMALTLFNGDLYIGGFFTKAYGGSPNEFKRIARWNGSIWSPLGSGMSDELYALTTFDKGLFAGGKFLNAGGGAVNKIARWNGYGWSAWGDITNVANFDTVRAFTTFNNELYAGIIGGQGFSTMTISGSSIGRWDGSAWVDVGSGLNGEVLVLTTFNGKLFAGGGSVTTVSNEPLASWDATVWSPVGDFPGYTPLEGVYALTSFNGKLYLGGLGLGFGLATNVKVNTLENLRDNPVYSWDGSFYSSLGDGFNDEVLALTGFAGKLYAGGKFDKLYNGSSNTLNHIAVWDDSEWLNLGSGSGLNDEVLALAVYPSLELEAVAP